jgi:MYXO-CTERM domain-containing protein
MTRVMPALSLLLALAAILAASPAHAAWTLLAKAAAGQDAGYFQVSAADATHAMAVGTHKDPGSGNSTGVVAVTTDGVSWQQVKPSTSPIAFYTAVHMVSAQKAFVGMTGQLMVTSDGGGTWTPYKEADWGPLKGPMITGVGFAGQSTGYLVGSGGTIRKTTDGGTTWTPVTGPAGIDWGGLFVLDAQHLWLWAGSSITDEQTGEITGYEDGTLAFSADGGATFTTVFEGEARAVARVFMINSDEGYMVSNAMAGPRLEHTTDGGKTWTAQPLPLGAAGGAPDTVFDVFFFDLCEGFLLQEQTENTQLMYTTDSGATWTQIPKDPFKIQIPLPIAVFARLAAFDFPSREVGFAGGFFESLAGYAADGAGPNCGTGTPDGGSHGGDGGGGGDDDGGGGCGCRAAGAGGVAGAVLMTALLGGLGARRRRRRG